MSQVFAERVISIFKLTGGQKDAALERKRDVVVTAGAGSGKTRTLVARYASLLAEGLTPRRVVAITFTEKAAREMRSRVRDALVELIAQAETDDERKTWLDLNAQMDAARIGTIHSLCAEILRNHPAEAGIDPRFDVLDEGCRRRSKPGW
jgi:ATP-dependent helicase/nuclease subunit A